MSEFDWAKILYAPAEEGDDDGSSTSGGNPQVEYDPSRSPVFKMDETCPTEVEQSQQLTNTEDDQSKNMNLELNQVCQYIKDHPIQEIFEYCLTLLVNHQPDKPTEYLSDFYDMLLKGKNDKKVFQSIPRTFNRHNLSALFRIFDKEKNGFITGTQYKNGMDYIGAEKFAKKDPEGHAEDKITKQIWISEATDAISRQIHSFIK